MIFLGFQRHTGKNVFPWKNFPSQIFATFLAGYICIWGLVLVWFFISSSHLKHKMIQRYLYLQQEAMCHYTALEGGWPCGRSLPRHRFLFPPSVELQVYDYKTLLNRGLEKSSCKLTKTGFVSRNGVSTQYIHSCTLFQIPAKASPWSHVKFLSFLFLKSANLCKPLKR